MLNKKIHIKTWGCQMNEYDSEKISTLLKNTHQYDITNIAEEADILILNTCSIREKAQEKVFHQLGRWKHIKQKNQNVIIGVGGCVASQEGDSIKKRAPMVDIIFGPQTLHRLPKMIDQIKTTKKSIIDISFPEIEKFEKIPIAKPKGPSACISIMEGCDKYCSFCIVPHTRGAEISRPYKDILTEIKKFTISGVREIHLLGQNVNSYFYEKNCKTKTSCSFAQLVHMISKIKKIKRIKFTTSHPIDFTDEVINIYETIPKLTNFLHLPIQSGSNKILEQMQRGYSVNEYKHIIKKLKKIRPNILIGSDFIVGFPNETKNDFYKTIKVIKDLDFDASFSFIYSPRPGTLAADLKDNVTINEKKKRLHILQKHINQQVILHTRRMLGSSQSVLVEGYSKKNPKNLFGRTENNRIVNFKGPKDMIGELIKIKIIDINLNTLFGEIK